MSNTRVQLVAVGCLVLGVLAGAAGAQAVPGLQRRFLNTGLFSVAAGETARFHVTLDDQRGQPPATVVQQLLDENGVQVASRNIVLTPGRSATLETPGPGVFRANAEVIDSLLQTTDRRATVGTVEVSDTITGIVRYVCSFDPVGIGGGKN